MCAACRQLLIDAAYIFVALLAQCSSLISPGKCGQRVILEVIRSVNGRSHWIWVDPLFVEHAYCGTVCACNVIVVFDVQLALWLMLSQLAGVGGAWLHHLYLRSSYLILLFFVFQQRLKWYFDNRIGLEWLQLRLWPLLQSFWLNLITVKLIFILFLVAQVAPRHLFLMRVSHLCGRLRCLIIWWLCFVWRSHEMTTSYELQKLTLWVLNGLRLLLIEGIILIFVDCKLF